MNIFVVDYDDDEEEVGPRRTHSCLHRRRDCWGEGSFRSYVCCYYCCRVEEVKAQVGSNYYYYYSNLFLACFPFVAFLDFGGAVEAFQVALW